MKATRVYCAGVVLGVTLASAAWLYTYRMPKTYFYIDQLGRQFHPPQHRHVQPWWGVPATVIALAVGGTASVLILPGQARRFVVRRLIPRRISGDFANPP